tara:strand:- start:859 stop:1161 length:303 start_codon:yes stop_codon:yes gene_type:complete
MSEIINLKTQLNMNKIEDFQTVIEGVKFTKAQKGIVSILLRGWEIRVVNRHHANGGTMMWKSPHSDYLEHAGKVYKAFFNVFYQIKKQKGIDVPTNLFCK